MHFEIPEYKFSKLEKKIKAIQKRCEEHDCHFKYEKGEPFPKRFEQNGKEIFINIVPIELEFEAVKNDWQLVALIGHYDNGNVITPVNNADVPDMYRTAEPVCQHCNMKIARKYTTVIRNITSGDYKQVGRSCLLDYTHGLSANMVRDFENILDLFNDKKQKDKEDYVPADEILVDVYELWTTSYNIIRKHGYQEKIPRSKKRSTVDRVVYILNNGDKCYNTKKGEEISAWLLANKKDTVEINNFKTLAKERYIRQCDISLAVKAAAFFVKIERYNEKRRNNSSFQGNVGDEISFEVAYTKLTSSFVSKFDKDKTINVYELQDTNGNIYVWFTGYNKLNTGDKGYTIKGCVKKHDEHNGVKQTVLSNCYVTKK